MMCSIGQLLLFLTSSQVVAALHYESHQHRSWTPYHVVDKEVSGKKEVLAARGNPPRDAQLATGEASAASSFMRTEQLKQGREMAMKTARRHRLQHDVLKGLLPVAASFSLLLGCVASRLIPVSPRTTSCSLPVETTPLMRL
ncbi:unnamed protein product [Durusdinium trenchii]|uniref:Uncharacterized protein n=2 Tax=Durusdinium trenchii TaxID=1381693 RepID=A0ABP0PXN4_9DINO